MPEELVRAAGWNRGSARLTWGIGLAFIIVPTVGPRLLPGLIADDMVLWQELVCVVIGLGVLGYQWLQRSLRVFLDEEGLRFGARGPLAVLFSARSFPGLRWQDIAALEHKEVDISSSKSAVTVLTPELRIRQRGGQPLRIRPRQWIHPGEVEGLRYFAHMEGEAGDTPVGEALLHHRPDLSLDRTLKGTAGD